MPRFFVPEAEIGGNFMVLTGDNAAHAKVLRLKNGDEVTVCDGNGTDYRCTVSDVASGQISLIVHAAVPAAVALASERNLHAVLHTCGNVDAQSLPLSLHSASVAAVAGIVDDFSGSVTVGTLRIRKAAGEHKAGLVSHLTGSVTGRAGLDVRLVLRALSSTLAAGYVSVHGDVFRAARGDFFQGKSHSDIKVLALDGTATA